MIERRPHFRVHKALNLKFHLTKKRVGFGVASEKTSVLKCPLSNFHPFFSRRQGFFQNKEF
jgi:hypothetical protein